MKSDLPIITQEDGYIIQNGTKYAPSREIAREFDYALSYIAFLARKNKINAVWYGKRWYVERDSVLKYKESAQNNKVFGGRKSQSNYIQLVSAPVNDSKGIFKKSDILRISSLFILVLFFVFGTGILPISINTDLLKKDYNNFQGLVFSQIDSDISLFFNNFSYFSFLLTDAAYTQISNFGAIFFNKFVDFTQTGIDINQIVFNLVLEAKFNPTFSDLPESATSFLNNFGFNFVNFSQSFVANIWESIYSPFLSK